MTESRKHPRVKSITDSAGNMFVRGQRWTNKGVTKERWFATVTAAGPTSITAKADRPVLMDLETSEVSPSGVAGWSEEHTTAPAEDVSAHPAPHDTGNFLLVDVTMRG